MKLLRSLIVIVELLDYFFVKDREIFGGLFVILILVFLSSNREYLLSFQLVFRHIFQVNLKVSPTLG